MWHYIYCGKCLKKEYMNCSGVPGNAYSFVPTRCNQHFCPTPTPTPRPLISFTPLLLVHIENTFLSVILIEISVVSLFWKYSFVLYSLSLFFKCAHTKTQFDICPCFSQILIQFHVYVGIPSLTFTYPTLEARRLLAMQTRYLG